ncbi:MAG: type 1 glutamine amidotransferase [Terriglobales bacterium]
MWAILQHAPWEGPGLIAAALDAHGFEFRVHRLDQGEAVPETVPDGLVVMGGPMGVYEARQFPFLSEEQRLLRACLAEDLPVLGVCLGAQLMAAALGAEVSRGATLEAGEGSVTLTGAGRADAVIGIGCGELPVVHWHQGTFPLPQGTELLASSRLYPMQAFRAGRYGYGLQFHLELQPEQARQWREQGLTITPEHEQRVREAGERVVDNFLHLAAARPALR